VNLSKLGLEKGHVSISDPRFPDETGVFFCAMLDRFTSSQFSVVENSELKTED